MVNNKTVLCGDDMPPNYYSEGNKLKLNFTSDYWLTYRGFKLNYHIKNADNTTTGRDYSKGYGSIWLNCNF